MLEVRKSKG